MAFRFDARTDTYTFITTQPPLQTFIVMCMLRPGEKKWVVSIVDATNERYRRIALTSCLQDPNPERAELMLRCYVDTDEDLEAFIQGRRRN